MRFFYQLITAFTLFARCTSLAPVATLPLALVGTSIVSEIYTRIPQQVLFGSTPPPLPDIPNKNVFLVFPGAGGPDNNTDLVINEAKKIFNGKADYFILCYDWQKWRGNFLRAAYDSESTGKLLGRQLAKMNAARSNKDKFQVIHTVGVSVGSFAADACINEFKAETKKLAKLTSSTSANTQIVASSSSSTTKKQSQTSSISETYTRLTLLDPFTSKGIYNSNFGENNFGKYSDYAEQYLNTDDEVPFTNKPLGNMYCYDVTGCRERQGFIPLPGDSMHSWPVVYYGRKLKAIMTSSLGNNKKPTHLINPRGRIENVL